MDCPRVLFGQVKELDITSEEELKSLLSSDKNTYIPMLVRRGDKIEFITVDYEYQYLEGDKLAYIGELN